MYYKREVAQGGELGCEESNHEAKSSKYLRPNGDGEKNGREGASPQRGLLRILSIFARDETEG